MQENRKKIEDKERYVPEDIGTNFMKQEHLVRYKFAASFVDNKKILDIACGSGYGCDMLIASKASEVIGIDISSEAIDYCTSHYSKPNLKFELGDGTSLKFEDKSFDVITSFEFIEHIKNPSLFLAESKRLLSDDGLFVVSTPNKNVYGLDNPFEIKEDNSFHIKEYDEQEFVTLLKQFFEHVVIFYQDYSNTLGILTNNNDQSTTEFYVMENGPNKKLQNKSKYFIAVCSQKKINVPSNSVYLFNEDTIVQANNNEYKKWIKQLHSDNQNFLKEVEILQKINEGNQKKLQYCDTQIESLQNSTSEKDTQIESLQNSTSEKDTQIESLQIAIENYQKTIIDIHQSFVLRMLHKYDKTIGKIIPLRPKKYIKSIKQQSTIEEQEIHTKNALDNVLEKKDIICFPIINWDFRYQRPQHILTEFAKKGHRVFYLTVNLRHLEKSFEIKTLGNNIFQIELNSPKFFDIYKDKFNESLVLKIIDQIKEIEKDLNLDAISFVEFPTWAPLVFELKKQLDYPIIFDCLDDFTGFSNVIHEREKEESSLIISSDLVLATSSHLLKKIMNKNKKSLYLPNAGEFEHFNKTNDGFLKYKKPIIGYFGSISDWFDTDLIEYLASNRSEFTFVMIGHTFGADIRKLQKFTNVHFLGERPYSELPKYLCDFDACLIPFKITPLIEATHPVKIYEYFAAGKPVIATNMTELFPMADMCYLAKDKEDFLKKLDLAVNEKDEIIVKKRIKFASENTWENRFETLYNKLKKIDSFNIEHHS